MKKLLSVILVVPILFTLAVPATGYTAQDNTQISMIGAGTAIKDAQPGQWYYEYSRWALSLGLLNVKSDIKLSGRWFKPYEVFDRSELYNALFIYAQYLNTDVLSGKSADLSVYKDVSDIRDGMLDAWKWACGSGLFMSNGENLLLPNDVVTREYVIGAIYRFAKLAGIDVSARGNVDAFSDKSKISANYLEAIKWAVGAGLINGTSESTLNPDNNAERVQLAAILYRYNEKYGKENYVSSETIELYGNPTTGYSWVADTYDEKIIKVSELMYIQDNSGLVGTGGTFGFSIRGVS